MITPEQARDRTQKAKIQLKNSFEEKNPQIVQSIERSIIEGTKQRNKYTRWSLFNINQSALDEIKDFLQSTGFTFERDGDDLIIRWL